jgi:drug/metabolite transporter (DMT)-like permease
MTRDKIIAISALVGAILCFSGNYVIGGIAVASTPLMSLMFIKWGTAAVPMLILAHIVERPDWRLALSHWKKIVVLSMLGIAGYSFMLYHALSVTTALNAALINAFNPALILAASALFLHETITAKKMLGVFVALLGVVWVLTRGDPAMLAFAKFNAGDIWMLGVILCWTAYTIIISNTTELPPLTNSALQMTAFTLLMTPFMLYEGITLPSMPAGLWSMAYIAIFPSAVAYALWNFGTRSIEPGQAGQFLNLVVPFTVILTLLLGGAVTAVDLIGGVMIVAGVYLTYSAPARTAARDRVEEYA